MVVVPGFDLSDSNFLLKHGLYPVSMLLSNVPLTCPP